MNDNASTETKVSKSIVPARYSGKYKGGGSDALANFINEQCKSAEGFDYSKFFELCRRNGLPEDKVAHYEGQVADKRLGSQGRARMTLRNMLATLVRKDSKIVDLDGKTHDLELPKVALAGAAASAKAKQETASH